MVKWLLLSTDSYVDGTSKPVELILYGLYLLMYNPQALLKNRIFMSEGEVMYQEN